MRIYKIIVVALLFGGVFFAKGVEAQTQRTFQRKDMHGQSTQVPYLRHEEYQNISLTSDSISQKSSSQSADANLTFGQLLSVASLDEVTHRLGEPRSTERRELSENMFIGVLRYEGLMLEYLKTGTEDLRLRKLHITDSDWSVTINGKDLRPGVKVNQLSSVVQQSMQDIENPPPGRPDVSASAVLHIASSGKGREGEKLEENTGFSFQIDDAGTIDAIIFHRLI